MRPDPTNPYQPGRGVVPPVIAGRTSEFARAERRLAALTDGRTVSEDLLYYGPRGNGKTTLLLEIGRRARESGLRAERFGVDALTDPERLIRGLQERAGILGDRVTGVQLAGIGATADRAEPTREVSALFGAWVGASPRPLLVILDEVHAIVPEVARSFFDAVQHAKGAGPPFVVAAAGTPDAPRRIREAGTHNERGFERVRVGRLGPEDTITALAEPARAHGRPMNQAAARLLAEESQGYPYFIQLLGSAAWESTETSARSEIGVEAARRGIAAARPRIEDFYGERFDEAWNARIDGALRPLADTFIEHGGQVRDADLTELLEDMVTQPSLPFDRVSLRNTLHDLGVVWQPAPGVWEMGIPSFAAYVRRRSSPAGAPHSN